MQAFDPDLARARGAFLRPPSAVSSFGGFRTPAAEHAALSFKRPASETLHKCEELTASKSSPLCPIQRTSIRRVATSPMGLVSRASPVHVAMRNYTRDEGGPFGVGNQVLISSHRKLLRSKAVVVSVAEKPGHDPGRRSREASASEPLQKCRKRIRRCQNRGVTLPPGSAWRMS